MSDQKGEQERPRCGARNRKCRKCNRRYLSTPKSCPECQRRTNKSDRGKINCPGCNAAFPPDEYNLMACPDCGESRICTEYPIRGSKRCKMHGGKSLEGPASPTWIGGQYSQAMQRLGLGELHAQVMESDLYDAKHGLAAMQTRALDLLLNGYGAQLYEAIVSGWREFVKALSGKDQQEKDRAFLVMDQLMSGPNGAQFEALRWREWERLELAIDKMRANSHKRAVESRVLVHLDVVDGLLLTMMYANKNILREYLKSKNLEDDFQNVVSAIGQEYKRLRGGSLAQRVDGGSGSQTDGAGRA